MSNSSTWLIDWTLSNTTSLVQSGPESDANEGVLHIPQSSSMTRASPSDYLMSYGEHSFGRRGPYSSAGDWAYIKRVG